MRSLIYLHLLVELGASSRDTDTSTTNVRAGLQRKLSVRNKETWENEFFYFAMWKSMQNKLEWLVPSRVYVVCSL